MDTATPYCVGTPWLVTAKADNRTVLIHLPHKNQNAPSTKVNGAFWWGEMDSNHRRETRQIYSLLPLAARQPPQTLFNLKNGAGDWNRTHNLLITSQLLCQLSYASINIYNSFWCLGAESNHRHGDFQSPALPTELPRQKKWRPGTGSNRRPPA